MFQFILILVIWGSHGENCGDYSLQRCDAVHSSKGLKHFKGKCCLCVEGRGTLKIEALCTITFFEESIEILEEGISRLQSELRNVGSLLQDHVSFQKTGIFIVTAVTTSNPKQCFFYLFSWRLQSCKFHGCSLVYWVIAPCSLVSTCSLLKPCKHMFLH
jgi:hypothetical protein